MSDLVPLHFEAADIRMVIRDGEPWWVGIDVVGMLDISKPHQALSRLEDYERGTYIIGTPSGDQEMIVINESGLYALLLTSRKPIAKAFKRWLTTAVLPSIRKWGCYPPPPIALENPAAENWAETSAQSRFIAECRRLAGEHGTAVESLLKHIVSKHQLRAIELGSGPVADLLTRDQRWVAFMAIGMDLSYVLHGVWDQTPHERRVKQQMRAAAAEQLQLR